MIITASLLNELENKFTAHGLGYESIAESELTYQKCMDAIENGYLPVVDSYVLDTIRTNGDNYYCIFHIVYNDNILNFYAYSPTEIMTEDLPL